MMTTVLRKHTKQYHHKSRFTRYLQYFRDVGLCYIVSTPTSGLRTLNFAVSNCMQKTRNWVGESFFFRRQYLKYFVHVALQCQPLFFSSSAPLLLPGEGGVGGGDDDAQPASNSCEA